MALFLLLQASEQYLIDSQFFAQDFLHVISFLQATQILVGKKLLLPLKEGFMALPQRSLSRLRISWACSVISL